MSQPPYGQEPGRPQDTPRSFPNYARPDDTPEDATQPLPASDVTQPVPTQPLPTEPPPVQSGWAAPGQPSTGATPGQSPYGQPSGKSPYGQPGQPVYGQPPVQPTYGQAPGPGQPAPGQPGPAPYGQQPPGPAPYGQQPPGPPPYGQVPVGYPAAYGYGYPGQAGGGTNSLAVAALVCGLGGFVIGISAPFGIGLGIAALVQLKRRPQDGKGMAIAGIVTGAAATLIGVLMIGLIIAGIASGSDDYSAPYPGPSTSSYSGTYVEDLAVGECFNDDGNQDEVVRKDCTSPHDGEIVSNVTLPEGVYPGDRKMDLTGKSRCATEFKAYVGKSVDQSEYEYSWWTPSQDSWDEDHDRLVVCAAYGADETLTRSVKGTKR